VGGVFGIYGDEADIFPATPPEVCGGRADEIFEATWPEWQAPNADGLVVAVTPDTSTEWADLLLYRDDDQLLVWAAAGVDEAPSGLMLLKRSRARLASLIPAHTHPRRAGLVLQVAANLATVRDRSGDPAPPVLTSVAPPVVPAGIVRVPHLVTTRLASQLIDTVVWEAATEHVARRWLHVSPSAPGFVSTQELVEARLDELLALRSEVRYGRFPPTAAGNRLAAALAGRSLSMEFCFQRPELIRALLATWGWS
jgi:hypothetical protein